MILNRIFTLLLISPLLFSSIAQADSSQTAAPDVKDFLPRQCYFSGRFAQNRNVESIPAPLESQGEFLFSCDHGLIWHTGLPTRETIIYTNSKKHYLVDADGKMEPLKGRLHANMALLLNGLMGADVHYLEKYFSFITTEPDNIELQPKKKNMRKFIEQLDLRKHGDSIEINLVNDARNNTVIRISDIQILSGLDIEQCREHFPEPVAVCDSLFRNADK